MTDTQTIKAICESCGDKGDVTAFACSNRECMLWPFSGGRRKRPWPNRVYAKQFSENKALLMYREQLES